MNSALPALISHSLLFAFFFSVALLSFIILRRLVVQRRDAQFQLRYLRLEQDVLQAISAGEMPQALAAALERRSYRAALTQVLIDFLEIISGRGQEILKVIFEKGLKDKCLRDLHSRFFLRRLKATRLVGLFSVLPDERLLLSLLKDKPLIRLAAVHAIAQLPGRESLALVFQAFEQESCPKIHIYTNIIFGAGEKVAPFIQACLMKGLPVEKLCLLIELAGAIPLPSLYPEVAGYAGHPEKEVRIKVAKALGKFLTPDSYGILERMADDQEWEVQAQALKAIGNLKNAGALVLLTRGLYSPSWYVRYNAREGLLSLGPLGIKRLEEVSSQKADRFASDMAAMALEEFSYSGVW